MQGAELRLAPVPEDSTRGDFIILRLCPRVGGIDEFANRFAAGPAGALLRVTPSVHFCSAQPGLFQAWLRARLELCRWLGAVRFQVLSPSLIGCQTLEVVIA
ncbi:hypothetical protein OG599_33330 [Streptomyces sp. NBC_01335]|uniref:hypothetical protein n=1 Tax=Streptomyces sp. NBC_01335 TaxID=2903828 RepID=UPI002E126089|nr:hypothetical protein OG599_33330 [Streptomyces sp. NBC_01335]